MDVTYIAAAPALARLHQEHHDHGRAVHRIESARLRHERTVLRRALRRVRARRTFALPTPAVPTTVTTTRTRSAGTVG